MSDGRTVLPCPALASWRGERVLVTGGRGFLGSHLCRRLAEVGADVHATSRQRRISEQGTTRWWQSDLSSLEEVRSILAQVKPAVIYHLAGVVGARPDLRLVLPTFESLLASTIQILVGATEVGCRRVILSGSFTEPKLGELSSTPSSPYAAAKWAASAYGRMFHALYRTPTVVVTPFMVFGPCQEPSKLVPSVILSLLKQEAPRLASGLRDADWIYVGDVVQGFLDAAAVPGIEGATFELGTGTKCTIREVVEKIVGLMDSRVKPVFGAIPDRPGEPIRIADTSETRRRLGWSAKTSLDEGLRQTIQWYAEQVSAGRL
ncbi:MAG: NAD-dependent dehydratase [Nitrospira sp. WS110]|nr:NAD-dependent dehydratase [Nitrospira sp. WS110]